MRHRNRVVNHIPTSSTTAYDVERKERKEAKQDLLRSKFFLFPLCTRQTYDTNGGGPSRSRSQNWNPCQSRATPPPQVFPRKLSANKESETFEFEPFCENKKCPLVRGEEVVLCVKVNLPHLFYPFPPFAADLVIEGFLRERKKEFDSRPCGHHRLLLSLVVWNRGRRRCGVVPTFVTISPPPPSVHFPAKWDSEIDECKILRLSRFPAFQSPTTFPSFPRLKKSRRF